MTIFLLLMLAQVPGFLNGCAACGVKAAIDLPVSSPDLVPPVPMSFLIAGWGFECASGRPVDRVDVFYSSNDGSFVPAPWWLTRLETGVPRPDVYAAYITSCPNVSRDTGWHLVLYPWAVPPGVRVLRINVWRGAYMAQSVRIVAVQ